MKRFFAMILTLCLLASMVVLPVSAANSPEDIRLMQDAVVETALSYFRAGTNIHYDWNAMTVQDRLYYGVSRVTSEIGLGAVAPDNPLYTNCAQFSTVCTGIPSATPPPALTTAPPMSAAIWRTWPPITRSWCCGGAATACRTPPHFRRK